MQLAGRDDHERPVADIVPGRADQQVVESRRGVEGGLDRCGRGSRPGRRRSASGGHAPQRESQVADLGEHVGERAETTEPDRFLGHRDGPEDVAELDQLEQCPTLQRGPQPVGRAGQGPGPTERSSGLPGPPGDGAFECGLAVDEGGGGIAVAGRVLEVGRHPA